MHLQFAQIIPDIPYILIGILITLKFTALSALCGFVLGGVLSLLKISNFKPLAWFGIAYTSVFRGTPLLVQLFIVYFATPELTGYDIPALEAGVITFALNSAAYISEVIRGGILGVDKGQREAALSLGVPYRRIMLDIIFPQALKNILPALVNEGIALLKDSSLVSTIGVLDVLRRGQLVQSNTYLAFEPYIIVAAIYYVLVMILTSLARRLERRIRRSD